MVRVKIITKNSSSTKPRISEIWAYLVAKSLLPKEQFMQSDILCLDINEAVADDFCETSFRSDSAPNTKRELCYSCSYAI
jgi:hypothetical protein